jgi:hypothetical protein
VKIRALIAALLFATAATAADPPAPTPAPEEKPEAQSFVLIPEWLWLQALQTMNAQQALIERLKTEKRNDCKERI